MNPLSPRRRRGGGACLAESIGDCQSGRIEPNQESTRLRRTTVCATALLLACISSGAVFAQGPPPARRHTVTQSPGAPSLEPATVTLGTASRVIVTIEGDKRVIRANGMPAHATGPFPNSGNPNRIRAQSCRYDVPASPALAGRVARLGTHNFGIAVDGVSFDPGAAEWYDGRRDSKWQYEPLSGAVRLGLDANYAHVQPTGAYHYHGLPTLLLRKLGLKGLAHSPLVGWAAAGFPIYARYGYASAKDSGLGIKELRSGYRLRKGNHPAGGGDPGGRYDGTFTADYVYVSGLGDLDECNGRETVTPDFPHGTYAYFLTASWPVIPRCYKGTPSRSFTARRGPPPGSARLRRPPHGHPPPGHRPPPFGRSPPR
jgi:hypothetical protein